MHYGVVCVCSVSTPCRHLLREDFDAAPLLAQVWENAMWRFRLRCAFICLSDDVSYNGKKTRLHIVIFIYNRTLY